MSSYAKETFLNSIIFSLSKSISVSSPFLIELFRLRRASHLFNEAYALVKITTKLLTTIKARRI